MNLLLWSTGATIKSRGHLLPISKCRKELYNPVGTDNAVASEGHSEHFTKPKSCQAASLEASAYAPGKGLHLF